MDMNHSAVTAVGRGVGGDGRGIGRINGDGKTKMKDDSLIAEPLTPPHPPHHILTTSGRTSQE